ncbi:MAG: hypothetical protein K2K41_06680 [Ruminiclostridium sp.]|nr:hypothetical protein [Ruminiclostridium sp.]
MAQAPRAAFSEPDKIFGENFVFFEIRAIRAVVRLEARFYRCCADFYGSIRKLQQKNKGEVFTASFYIKHNQ